MRVNFIPSKRIIECIQVDETQLRCMLQGTICSFQISSHNLRFVNDELPAIFKKLKVQSEEEQLRKLCNILVTEIIEGRTIVETKQDNKVFAIVSPSLFKKLKQEKTYDDVLLGSERFFEEVASGFNSKLQELLDSISAANKEQSEAEKSFLATSKKDLDRKIVAENVSSWGFVTDYFAKILSRIYTSLSHTVAKIYENIKEDAHKEERLAREKHNALIKKERRIRKEDREFQNRKSDVALQEHKLQVLKEESLKS